MSILFYGTSLIFIAFFIHLLIWKIYLPRNQTKTLLYIFSGTLISGIFILWKFAPYITFFGIPAPRTIWEYLQLSFLFISLTLAYIATYSGLEVDSPSLTMVLNIAQTGSNGLDKNAFEQIMSDDVLVVPRVKDLVAGKLVHLDGEVYKLTKKGIFIARIFIAYRRLLKRPQKGG